MKQVSVSEAEQTQVSFKQVISTERTLLLVMFMLTFIGILLVISPKWSVDWIHIRLSRGHAITTQDVVALVPLSIAGLLFIRITQKYFSAMRTYVTQAPEQTIVIALVIGIIIGNLMGYIFNQQIEGVVKLVLEPIRILVFGVGY